MSFFIKGPFIDDVSLKEEKGYKMTSVQRGEGVQKMVISDDF